MFRQLSLFVIAAHILFVCADPTPTAPGPGSVFNQGATCRTDWTIDSTGKWTSMSIQLMTGDNFNMISLADLATVDATTQSSYTFTCPQVTLNSAVYFYQFKSPSSANTYWTTRFAIADASGATTPAPNATQPNGAQIPWGVGALVGAGGNPAPSSSPSSSSFSTLLPSPSSSASPPVFTVSQPASGSSTFSSLAGPITSTTVVGSPQVNSNSAPAPSTTSTTSTHSSGASSVFSCRSALVGVAVIITVAFVVVF